MINHQHHKATGGQQENRNNIIDSIPSVTGATSPRPVRKISRPPNALQSPLSSMESASIATLPDSQPSPRHSRKISRAPNISSDAVLLKEIEANKLNHLDEDGIQDPLFLVKQIDQEPKPGHADTKTMEFESMTNRKSFPKLGHPQSKGSNLRFDGSVERFSSEAKATKPAVAVSTSSFTFDDSRGATGTRELERLLRIAKRDNQVLMIFFISPVFLVSFGSSITTGANLWWRYFIAFIRVSQ